MIVECRMPGCMKWFDDEFRSTICPHKAFPANDGSNNFTVHDDAYLSDTAPTTSAYSSGARRTDRHGCRGSDGHGAIDSSAGERRRELPGAQMTKAIVVGVLAVLLMTGCAMQRYSSHLKHGGVLYDAAGRADCRDGVLSASQAGR